MNEEKKENGYSLYTEDIVEKPSVKYRKIIKIFKFVAAAVLFGFVAAISMTFFGSIFGVNNKNEVKRTPIVLQRDEYPTSSQNIDVIDKNIDETITENTESASEVNFERIIKSMVKVIVKGESEEGFLSEDNLYSSGVVIAEVDNEFLLITNYNKINKNDNISIEFYNGDSATGYLVKGSKITNIALVSVKESDLSMATKAMVKVVGLGNSYKLAIGEKVYSCGKIYGVDFSLNEGRITNNLNNQPLVDLSAGLIYTNILNDIEDENYLFDAMGNLIGFPVIAGNDEETSKMITMEYYGVSDLKAHIEALANGTDITYCGIVGENITLALSEKYAIPMGVFVKEVVENSPAYNAGIQAGDIITSVNDETTLTFNTFSEKIYKLFVGEKATINVKRFGKNEYKDVLFSVTLQGVE